MRRRPPGPPSRQRGGAVAWLALLIALAALALAWIAVGRTGGLAVADLARFAASSPEAVASRRWEDLRRELERLDGRLAAWSAGGRSVGAGAYRDILAEVRSLRRRLAAASEEGSGTARRVWRDLDGQLAAAEEPLRRHAAGALEAVSRAIEQARRRLAGAAGAGSGG